MECVSPAKYDAPDITTDRGRTMKTVIFLNEWNNLYHLMLSSVDGEVSRHLDSRSATSLEQVRKTVDYWRTDFNVAAEDVHDNSMVVWMTSFRG